MTVKMKAEDHRLFPNKPDKRPFASGLPRTVRTPRYVAGRVEVYDNDRTSPIVAKNYNGYRMVFDPESDEQIFSKYVSHDMGFRKFPTKAELDLFKKDLSETALKNPEVKAFLQRYPI